MNKTKIEWCDGTWNPVTGCLHDCKYCYARKIANRFGGSVQQLYKGEEIHDLEEPMYTENNMGKITKAPYPYDFEPTFHRYRLEEPMRMKKTKNIFVCSMADLFGDWVPDEWIWEVFKACEAAPQHRYLFLTKNPKRYLELYEKEALPYSGNIWLGSSITTSEYKYAWFKGTPFNGFASVEPMLEPLHLPEVDKCPEWVIIGAETGNRKGKVVPKAEWTADLVMECDALNIPVFMKDSLIPIVGEDNMRREFPWGAWHD